MSKEIDLGWLAGIFDGEGCVSLNYKQLPIGGVAISNKDEAILSHCKEITAVLGVPRPRFYSSSITLMWSGYAGTQVLQLLVPHMHNSKHLQRAEIYCKFFDSTKKFQRRRGRGRSLQLWEEWKDLVRREWQEGKHRGFKPYWLRKEVSE